MKDWTAKLDDFLTLNDREILADAGRVSHQLAMNHAHEQYMRFDTKRLAESDAGESDFDRATKALPSGHSNRKADA